MTKAIKSTHLCSNWWSWWGIHCGTWDPESSSNLWSFSSISWSSCWSTKALGCPISSYKNWLNREFLERVFLFSSIPESPERDAGNWRTGPWKQKPGRVISTDLKQNSSSEILDMEPKRPFWKPEVSNMFWWFRSPSKDDWGQNGWNLSTILRDRNRLS